MSEPHLATGVEYLELVTTLLQRARLADPTAGLWEAGDLQWWWRSPRPSDDIGQLFWLDASGTPEAALILTAWGRSWGCDPLVLPAASDRLLGTVWERGMDRVAELDLAKVETLIRDDDEALQELAVGSGFKPTDETGAVTWMRADERPPVASLAEGFRLRDRVHAAAEPHHMIPRSMRAVAERLAETSLYRPDLDLFIEAPNGDVAGYGLFWYDPVTGVGLVEPMRTEEPYQRLGLARHVLTAGLDRLAAAGAQRLKIGFDNDNPAAKTLYLGTGFHLDAADTAFELAR